MSYGYYSLNNLTTTSGGTGDITVLGINPVEVAQSSSPNTAVISLFEAPTGTISFSAFNKSLSVINLTSVGTGSFNYISVSNLTGGTGYFSSISANTGSFNHITIDEIDCETGTFDYIQVAEMTGNTGSFNYLTNLEITSSTGNFTYIDASSGTFYYIDVKSLTGGTGTFDYLEVKTLQLQNLDLDNLEVRYIFTGSTGHFTNIFTNSITGNTGYFTNLEAQNLQINNLDLDNLEVRYYITGSSGIFNNLLVNDNLQIGTQFFFNPSSNLDIQSINTGLDVIRFVEAIPEPYILTRDIQPISGSNIIGSFTNPYDTIYTDTAYHDRVYISQDTFPNTTNRLYFYNPNLSQTGYSIRSPTDSVFTINSTSNPTHPMVQISVANSNTVFDTHLNPTSSLTYNLGSTGFRWNTLYCNDIVSYNQVDSAKIATPLVSFAPQNSTPVAVAGNTFYDNNTNQIKFYNGTAFVALSQTGPQGFQGPQGQQGHTGFQGPQGHTGFQGAQGPTGFQGVAGQSNSYYFYKAKTTSNTGDPGDGYITWNTGTQRNSTIINIDHLDTDNTDIDIFLALIKTGDKLIIQHRTDSASYQTWNVNSTPTILDNQYGVFPVSFQTGAGDGYTNFSNNQDLILVLLNIGQTGPQGPQGFQGPQGQQGHTGFQGPQGFQGQQGHTGFQGPQGQQGHTGFQGPQGIIGPTGIASTFYTFNIATGTLLHATGINFSRATGTNLDLTGTLQVAGRTDLGVLYTSDDVDIEGTLRIHENTTDMTALINLGYTGSVSNFRAGYIYVDNDGDMFVHNQEPKDLFLRTDNGTTYILLDGADNQVNLNPTSTWGQTISRTGVFYNTTFQTPATGSNSKCAIISYGNFNAGTQIAGPNFTGTDLVQMLLGGLNNAGANGGWAGRERATYKLGITSYSNDPAQDLNPIYPIYCVSEDAWIDTTLPDFYVKGTILSSPDNFSAEVFTRGNISIGYPYASTGAVYNAQRLLNTDAPRFYINNTTTRPSLFIEDSSFPDTSPIVFDATGTAIFGATSSSNVNSRIEINSSANTNLPLVVRGTTFNGGNSTSGFCINQGFSDTSAKQIIFQDMDYLTKNSTNAYVRITLFTGASGEGAIGAVSSNSTAYMPMSYEGNPIKFFSNASFITSNPRMVYNANGLQLTDEAFRTNNPAFMTVSENIDARPDSNTLPVQLSIQSSLTGALGRLDIGAGKNVLGSTGKTNRYISYIQSNGNLTSSSGSYDLYIQPNMDINSKVCIGNKGAVLDPQFAGLCVQQGTLSVSTGTTITYTQFGVGATGQQSCYFLGTTNWSASQIATGATVDVNTITSWRRWIMNTGSNYTNNQFDVPNATGANRGFCSVSLPVDGLYEIKGTWMYEPTGTLGTAYFGIETVSGIDSGILAYTAQPSIKVGVPHTLQTSVIKTLYKDDNIAFAFQTDQALMVRPSGSIYNSYNKFSIRLLP